MKKALILGVTGQDGSYLSELLLKKDYKVLGVMRRLSMFNTERIEHLYTSHPDRFDTAYGDLIDGNSLRRVMEKFEPDEVYNFGAQSHVRISFDMPESTFTYNANSTLIMLELIKNYFPKCKYYHACSSEMFGAAPPPQSETTEFLPQSVYGVSKVASYYLTNFYRRAFNLYACTGILFNHESPRRSPNFVTRKITMSLARLIAGEQKSIELGNLSALRDWGFAGDYVEAIWKIMQQDKPDNFVVSTGENYSVKDFVENCFNLVGLDWKKFVKTDVNRFLRPAEVPSLLGDSTKARKALNWKPKVKFNELCIMMLEHDLKKFNENIEKTKKIAKTL